MDIVWKIILSVGVGSMIVGLVYIGRKLQILDDLKKTTDKVKQNLAVVCNFLIKNDENFSSTELQALSPYQLTQVGKEFISKVGFDKAFEEHRQDFFLFIDEESPKLKYDVENAAIKSVAALYEREYMKFLKVYFYNHPSRNLENTAPTLGVYVRDAYLKEHPEITE